MQKCSIVVLARIALFSLAALGGPVVQAQEGTDPEAPTWSDMVTGLDRQTGQVTVRGGKATVAVPEGWHYVHQDDARFLVEDVWGNPPDEDTLGLLMPPGFESDEEGSTDWAIIISYDGEGHTEDGDAAEIDYDELLDGMQAAARQESVQREKEGYEAIEIVGWAERPHYDAAEKKLYWAKHIRFGGTSETLNYDIRILGRRGTLVLQAVASMDQLPVVRRATADLLPAIDFVEGERYADYKEGIDPVVAGGIGALIGGKLLLKGGFLKLLAGLWKPLAIGFVALGGFLMKVLGRKKEHERAARRRERAAGAAE